jgi:capsular exopolysaccharide synthesis family protein
LITLKQRWSPISEAYRSLRTAVLFANVDNQIKTLLVTSPSPVEGKSVTVANLGIVMAQAGHRVLIIDADLRRPTQHQIFGLTKNYGLTNLLVEMTGTLDKARLVELYIHSNSATAETQQPGLKILPSGPPPPNPSEVIGSKKLKMLIDLVGSRFDYIIIDSPPILAVTDAVILGNRVDSVLLVTKSGSTRRNQMKQAVQRLQEVNANISGVVLNFVMAKGDEYYTYYSQGYNKENQRRK